VREQKAAEAAAREAARRAETAAHRTAAEAAEQQRREQRALMFKRTARGQPVMKFRLDKLLSKLQS
jgi:apyrase